MRLQRVPLHILLLGLGLAVAVVPSLASAQPAGKLERLKQQWVELRAKALPSQPGVTLRPRLSAAELRQLRRIARMPHVSVVGDHVVGANEAYYQAARSGEPRADARMLSLDVLAGGLPGATTQRGSVTLTQRPWFDGGVARELEFRAPEKITSRRLRDAGVYPRAQVSVRKLPGGSAGIAIAPPGRIQPIGWDADGYEMLPKR